MWILNWLPDIVFHAIFALGCIGILLGFVLSFIPGINLYKLPIQIISIVLFSVGLWYEGGISKDQEWQSKVDKLNIELAQAQIKGEKINTEVVTKVLTKKQIIREKGQTVIEYIDREVAKSDSTCTINSSVILAHNAAATNMTEILTPNTEILTLDHNQLARSKIKLPLKQ